MTTDEVIRDRLRMLVAVDESLGRIMDALEKQGVLDKTVIMLVGDNGYFYGEHGLSEERRLAYEESIRVPLLIRYPPKVRLRVEARGSGPDHRHRANDSRSGGSEAPHGHRRTVHRPALLCQGNPRGLAALVPDRVTRPTSSSRER